MNAQYYGEIELGQALSTQLITPFYYKSILYLELRHKSLQLYWILEAVIYGSLQPDVFRLHGTPPKLILSWVHHRFDRKKSNSYVEVGKPFSIQYGTGALEGVFAKDTLTIAG